MSNFKKLHNQGADADANTDANTNANVEVLFV